MAVPVTNTWLRNSSAVNYAAASDGTLAIALWDHSAVESGELSLKSCDVVHILDFSDPDWWWAAKGQHYGWVPSSYVKVIWILWIKVPPVGPVNLQLISRIFVRPARWIRLTPRAQLIKAAAPLSNGPGGRNGSGCVPIRWRCNRRVDAIFRPRKWTKINFTLTKRWADPLQGGGGLLTLIKGSFMQQIRTKREIAQRKENAVHSTTAQQFKGEIYKKKKKYSRSQLYPVNRRVIRMMTVMPMVLASIPEIKSTHPLGRVICRALYYFPVCPTPQRRLVANHWGVVSTGKEVRAGEHRQFCRCCIPCNKDLIKHIKN